MSEVYNLKLEATHAHGYFGFRNVTPLNRKRQSIFEKTLFSQIQISLQKIMQARDTKAIEYSNPIQSTITKLNRS